MSYTTFCYSEIYADGEKVSVSVKNTGKRPGCEVVQLYITDDYCRITPFVRQLRGFEKVWLQPDEEQTVTFALGFEDFAFINENMEREVEPGTFTITIGTQQIKVTI